MIAQIKLDGEQYTRVSVIYEPLTGYNDLETLKSSLFFLLSFVNNDINITSKDLEPVMRLLEKLQLSEEQQRAVNDYLSGRKTEKPKEIKCTLFA